MDQAIIEKYSLRPIELKDNPYVKKLVVDVMTSFGCVGSGFSSSDPELDDMYNAYDGSRSVFYVVVDARDIVKGCGGIAPLIGSDSDICELRKMYFYPDIRGLGLGSRLMAICLSEAKKYGFKKCYIETIADMDKARILYEKSYIQYRCLLLYIHDLVRFSEYRM
jgi:putative acetyltransferase